MPLFGDQFGNAQRIVEKNLGIHFNPYYCSEEGLLQSFDRLLNDKEMAQNFDTSDKNVGQFRVTRIRLIKY
jgi:UDP:flavonoid glycosyltransferase YjiC (YdhE family)